MNSNYWKDVYEDERNRKENWVLGDGKSLFEDKVEQKVKKVDITETLKIISNWNINKHGKIEGNKNEQVGTYRSTSGIIIAIARGSSRSYQKQSFTHI